MFGSNNRNRKYVDLVFRSRGQYPNLDPTTSMEVGDYGYVTRNAMFRRQGNLFKEEHAQGLAKETGSRMGVETIMAEGTKSFDVDENVAITIPGFAGCSIISRYSFSKGCGAVLVMYQPIVTAIKNSGNIEKLYKDGVLSKNQAVVTRVFACPSYALLLGGEQEGNAMLGFRAKSPPIGEPGVEVSSKVGWVGKTSSGEWQWGHDADKRDVYFPLCELVGIHRRVGVQLVRDLSMPKDDESYKLIPYLPPWDLLDEDGFEEMDHVPDGIDDEEVGKGAELDEAP